jgi:hypothetical protein
MKRYGFLLVSFLASVLPAAESEQAGAPSVDRVGFPKAYQAKYQVLRTVNKKEEQKVVTVYGNPLAASITNAIQLPYPKGSIIVMETASALSLPAVTYDIPDWSVGNIISTWPQTRSAAACEPPL